MSLVVRLSCHDNLAAKFDSTAIQKYRIILHNTYYATRDGGWAHTADHSPQSHVVYHETQ